MSLVWHTVGIKEREGSERFNLPLSWMEGISFWWPISMYRQFSVLLWAAILILITLLISCDSQGEALPNPKSLCIAEGAPPKPSHPHSHFRAPILHLWQWFAGLPLLKVGFFFLKCQQTPQSSTSLILLPEEKSAPAPTPPGSDVDLYHTDTFHRFMFIVFQWKRDSQCNILHAPLTLW